jgi:hypothetical protein
MAQQDLRDNIAASGTESVAQGVTTASKNMQAFAGEIGEMSKQSLEHATEALEKLRNAHGMTEILAIQTSFAREGFEHMARHTRRFSELMATFPIELIKTYQEAWMKALNAAGQTTEAAKQNAALNVERFSDSVRKS